MAKFVDAFSIEWSQIFLLCFFTLLFKKGLSYSVLNTARSAVFSIEINVSVVQDHIFYTSGEALPCLPSP